MKPIGVGLLSLLFSACSAGNTGAPIASTNRPPVNAPDTNSTLDHTSADAVLAAYIRATDAGDEEALIETILPSERDAFSGGTGTGMDSTWDIVERKIISANEIHLVVKFTNLPARAPDSMRKPLPHALIRHDGKWYVSVFKTAELMSAD